MAPERQDRSEGQGDWAPPPADECEEFEYESPIGDAGEVMRVRQCWDFQQRLVDFAIIQMAPYGGRLVRVAVADICHGELHIHVFDRQGEKISRESLQPIDTYEDVDEGYDAGLDRIEKKWEDYKRRWSDG